MAKKKKKSKSQKKNKVEKEKEIVESSEIVRISLGDALSSAKKTETTLQMLLKGSPNQGFVHRKKEEEENVKPHLSHESRNKMAEDYLKEDILLAQRTLEKKKTRTSLIPQEKKKPKTSKTSTQKVKPSTSSPSAKKPPVEAKISKSQVSSKVSLKPLVNKNQPIQKTEEITTSTSAKKEPTIIKKVNIYVKLTEFFEGLLKSYNARYDRWENSISDILAILRKMRKITKKNTEDLVGSINNIFEKIQIDLEQFKIKRKEIEKVSEVNIESMSGEFKRVLGLLELQIKEYSLKRETDKFIREIRYTVS